jgi:hypothetical protein
MARAVSVAGVTVIVAVAVIVPADALIVDVPGAVAVARPFEPLVSLIVAIAVLEERHVTEAVKSCTVLSEYVPVAANC